MVLLLTFVFKQGGTNMLDTNCDAQSNKFLAGFMDHTKSQNITHGKIVTVGPMLHQPLIVKDGPLKSLCGH